MMIEQVTDFHLCRHEEMAVIHLRIDGVLRAEPFHRRIQQRIDKPYRHQLFCAAIHAEDPLCIGADVHVLEMLFAGTWLLGQGYLLHAVYAIGAWLLVVVIHRQQIAVAMHTLFHLDRLF